MASFRRTILQNCFKVLYYAGVNVLILTPLHTFFLKNKTIPHALPVPALACGMITVKDCSCCKLGARLSSNFWVGDTEHTNSYLLSFLSTLLYLLPREIRLQSLLIWEMFLNSFFYKISWSEGNKRMGKDLPVLLLHTLWSFVQKILWASTLTWHWGIEMNKEGSCRFRG